MPDSHKPIEIICSSAHEDETLLSAKYAHQEKIIREAQEAHKYHLDHDGTMQGQVVGDHNKVELHFHGSQDKATSSTKPERSQNIPYLHNNYFIGREKILEQLHTHFKADRKAVLALCGLGGIGKTQIAIEYAYCYDEDYNAVLWVRAESHEALTSSLVEIATLLDLPQKDAQDQSLAVKAVKRWLETKSGWLLIVDNVDEPAIVREFLLTKSSGHILLTMQSQTLAGQVQYIQVEALTPELGAHFLLRRATLIAIDASIDQATPQDREVALQISKKLGGLPLALDQAGAYIEQAQCSLSDYQNLYHTHRAEMLNERGHLVDGDPKPDHPESVATTLSICFEKIEQKSPAAAELLRFCAFLHPDAIPEKILTAGAEHLGPLLQTLARDPMALDRAIAALRAYSLILRKRAEEGKTLSIHQLVQDVLRAAMPAEEEKLWAEQTVLAMSKACPDMEFKTWQQWEQYLPHALVCINLVEQENLMFPEAAHLLNNAGNYLCERARYTEAKELYQRCLNIWKLDQEHEHPDVAYFLRGLGNVYSELGAYDKAKKSYLKSLRIFKRGLGYDHPEVARSLNNLAILCKVQGNYWRAEVLYRRSLRIFKQRLGLEPLDVAQSLNNLAVLYAEQGDYERAQPLFERSLRIRKQIRKHEHPYVAQSSNNLANLYAERGKYEEAELLFQESLRFFEQSQGPGHSDIAYPLNGLAVLYTKQSKYEEAELLFQKSLDIWKQKLRADHPQVAYSRNNQAILHKVQGKYEEAERLFQESLHFFEQSLGRKHPHTQRCVENYANLLHILKRDAEVLDLKRKYISFD